MMKEVFNISGFAEVKKKNGMVMNVFLRLTEISQRLEEINKRLQELKEREASLKQRKLNLQRRKDLLKFIR